MLSKLFHLKCLHWWYVSSEKKTPPESAHGKPRFDLKSKMADIVQVQNLKWT